ncbi:MAG: UvrD-helicase domain-containing protein [Candidatus Omnitrophica bacterium]|nr:UvrD-helicase domain-containing protein [Candidatus Omnitrophota bacterium]
MNSKNKQSIPSDLPRVLIVEASAGSGKTYALARRYIQLLIDPGLAQDEIPLKNILAITFTNKAAGEMKERILEFLKKISLDKFKDAEEKANLLSFGFLEDNSAKEKAYKIIEYIIRNYNFFQVQTIDSFINLILSGCAAELELSANFRIKERYVEYLKYSLDECIEKAADDKHIAKVFDNFLKQYLYIENKSSWFVKNNILETLKSLFDAQARHGGDFGKFDVSSAQIIRQKHCVYESLRKLKQRLPAKGLDRRFVGALENFLDKNDGIFDLNQLSSKYFEKESLPLNKGHTIEPACKDAWRKIRQDFARIAEQEAMSLFNCYIDIFKLVYDDFRKFSRNDDVLFLSELNQQARGLFIKENFSLPELYYRLATRFRHYLIDEFQDTSRLQWGNLEPLIKEAISSEGSLFYVGDKKQAIYRFRGGEVNLFDELKVRFRDFRPADIQLSMNFRSQAQIVQFNNRIFSRDNIKRFIVAQQPKEANSAKFFTDDDISAILNVFAGSEQKPDPEKDKGFVSTTLIECKDNDEKEELIREKTVELVSELRGRFALSDIAILCRSNQEIELVTGWLIEKGIAVESERTLNIKNNGLIKELVSFLYFLNSPVDNLSFAAFLSGQIFPKISGLDSEQIRDFLFGARVYLKADKSFYLYRHFQKIYPEIWNKFIAEFFKNIGLIPLYELVVNIVEHLGIFKNFSKQQGFIMRFLELIKKEEEEHASVSDFLEFLDDAPEKELYVDFSAGNAVKLLTIHKAKGLGFSVVILPLLEMDVSGKGRTDYVVCQELDTSKLTLLRLDAKYIRFSEKLNKIYHKEYLRSFIDELNTLYVSLTRAKEEIYIFIPKVAARHSNIAVNLIPEGYLSRGEISKLKAKAESKTSPIMDIPAASYREWISYLKEEFIPKSQLENKERIKSGEFTHAVLSHINNLEGVDFEKTVNFALAKARAQYPLYRGVAKCVKVVNALLKSKSVKELFYLKNAQIFTEKELVNRSGHTKRIDRLVITAKEAWVIDYKSTPENKAEHAAQVREYQDIISSIYPGRKVRGFLVYMDEIRAEEL